MRSTRPDRPGPWYNARGELIAKNVEDFHTQPNLPRQIALTEKNSVVNGRGDTPNMHDILTGSDSHGRALAGTSDTTRSNWTSSADSGSAQVGHSDRIGLRDMSPQDRGTAPIPRAGAARPRSSVRAEPD